MTLKKESSVAEYMRIRRYMLRFVKKAGSLSLQVPTILELTRKFNVSRPTVNKAMKALTEDGYIIGRRGIGGFTNPAKLSYQKVMPEYKTVAILLGDGMFTQYYPYFSAILGELFLIFSKKKYGINLINLSTHNTDRIMDEISLENPDLILWISPDKVVADAIMGLREQGTKLITAGDFQQNSAYNIFMDYEGMGYAVGKALIAENRKRVLYMFANDRWAKPWDGMKKAYSESGISLNEEFLVSRPDIGWDELRKIVETKDISAVFNAVCQSEEFLPFYNSLSQKKRKNCRFIVPSPYESYSNFTGWCFITPVHEYAKAIGRIVDAVMNDTPCIESIGIPFTIIDINGKKKDILS